MRHNRPLLRILPLAGALAAASLTSCEEAQTFYKIVAKEAVVSGSCAPDPGVPVDSTTLYSSGTYVIIHGADGVAYLETDFGTFEGSETETGFGFRGDIIDYEDLGSDTLSTQTTQIEITADLDGALISGSSTTTITWSCVGVNCPMTLPLPCTSVVDYHGHEIEVELERAP